MDTQTFNAVFFSFVITSSIGCILGIARMCYKSKCISIKCFGFELIRDTKEEEKIDELELERHTETKSNNNII